MSTGEEMDSDSKIVTKIEAAREQLESAINLFFNDESFVSVHTLCSAAFNILKDISKKNDGDFAFEMEVRIKPEFLGEWYKKTNKPANFFKHADSKHVENDSDPHTTIEFNERINDLKLMACCWGYKEIAGSRTPIMEAYMNWMLAFHPSFFKLGAEGQLAIKSAQDSFNVGNWDRKDKKSVGKLLLKHAISAEITRNNPSWNTL